MHQVIFLCLHIGTEVELSVNFAGYDGFVARPCLGTKWVF